MDRKISQLIKAEYQRQSETINLIPSENYASLSVRQALGSFLGNKYAEGKPGKRYYQGSFFIDQIEQLAIDRAKKVFGVPYANVQPHSGSPANMAVYLALCQIGQTIMGMDLRSGGHLTHGSPVSFSGQLYKVVSYGVGQDGWLNYREVEKLARQYRPKIIWAGATAYPRFFDWKKFAKISDSCGAFLIADISHYAGLVAGGSYPSPVPFADVITLTTHKSLRGPRGAIILVTKKGLRKDKDLAKKIDRAVYPGLQGGPHIHTIAGIAVALGEAQKNSFKKYARQVIKNAKVLADELVNFGFDLISGGTDNHLVLIDLRKKKINGKEAAVALERAGIVTNANAIPNDLASMVYPSGLRLGTPAVTTRGMKEKEIKMIAGWINEVIQNFKQKTKLKKINQKVKKLCHQFPIENV